MKIRSYTPIAYETFGGNREMARIFKRVGRAAMLMLPGPRREALSPEDIERLEKRRDYTDKGFETGLYNESEQIITGPPCDHLYPYLAADTWEYTENSPLAAIDAREMIASTVLAVLPYASDYTTIVGEDTSGRIPALVLGGALNTVRKRHGLTKARQVFVSGRIGKQISPNFRAENSDDAALLVTEYISSGYTIAHGYDALIRAGFEHISIATVDRNPAYTDYDIEPEALFMGDHNSYTVRSDKVIYKAGRRFSGVEKEYGDAHASAASLSAEERQILIRSRRDLNHFTEEVVKIWDRNGNA